MQILKDQKEELNKKRERVLSACGVRQPYLCNSANNLGDSPRIAVHNKKDSFTTNKETNNPKNMPKAPKLPGSQNINNIQPINYKLPPRPGSRQSTGTDNGKVNQSYDYNRNSREKSSDRIST